MMSFLAQTVLSTLITARKVVIIRIIMSELAIQVCTAIWPLSKLQFDNNFY